MPFTIPNTISATYPEQAQVDKLDLDVLAAGANLTGTISGCGVTTTSGLTVRLAAGTVRIAGRPVAVAQQDFTLTADATQKKFYLISVNTSGTGTAEAGSAAASPTFPDVTGAYAFPPTKVIQAAVLVPGGATTLSTASNIVDKRVPVPKVDTLNLLWYGAVAGVDSGSRALNNAAIQAAVNAVINNTGGARQIFVPGDFDDVYGFDTTITLGTGVAFTSGLEQALGPQLHYYGAINTHAMQSSNITTPVDSYFSFKGLRLEDKRADPGTGNGLHLYVTNGTHIVGNFFRGFYRNVYTFQNDIVDIRNNWLAEARNTSCYVDQPFNQCLLEMNVLDCDIANGAYAASMVAGITIQGSGGNGGVVNITDTKYEGTEATFTAVYLKNIDDLPVKVENLAIRGVASGCKDAVLIDGSNEDGIGECVTLINIECRTDGATPAVINLLRVDPADVGEYIVPGAAGVIIFRNKAEGTVLRTQATPTTAVGAGAGTGGSVAVSAVGDDRHGVVTVVTGSSMGSAADASIFTLTFKVPYPRHPYVTFAPANAAAAALSGTATVHCPNDAGTSVHREFFRLRSGAAALAAGTTYKWSYRVTG